ncbi:SDR family oxidoreductase [Paracoccus sp. (in: a-proteobacteria)]|uniref:SDR family oxidoreductase n=1 Tax=Paracoccus sp. TaxID=267 RepID=UPI0026DF9CFB|nr:SDR family oxidoreductase [Paracoccus sp. (in: a-proteobacteria)]MDO5647019.1 SDR family oxidoreductase [Paracoccus sp. (in: a-proteobacteria)]
MKMLIFGHGYSAGYLTPELIAAGWDVTGTTRSDADRVAAAGARALIWPGQDDDVRAALREADAVLVSAAPMAAGDPVLAAFRDDLAQAPLKWVGYLSTTGVYGDRQGGWVDETSVLDGQGPRGQARIRAEDDWRALSVSAGWPLHVFRLAGIYGPGRGPFAKLRDGSARRIIKPGQVFSRIHVTDIAQVLMASLARMGPGGAYNVCDDDPAPPQDVIAHAAELLGLPVPPAIPFDQADMSPMARSFYGDSKRVRNDKIKRDLGVTLRYPDYHSGLADLLASGG